MAILPPVDDLDRETSATARHFDNSVSSQFAAATIPVAKMFREAGMSLGPSEEMLGLMLQFCAAASSLYRATHITELLSNVRGTVGAAEQIEMLNISADLAENSAKMIRDAVSRLKQ